MVRGFLGGISNTQVRLDLRKTLPKFEKRAQILQEEMLHWEAVTRIGKGHRVSTVVPDSTSRLVHRLNEVVKEWKAQNESREAARIGRRISGDRDDQRSKKFSSMRSTSRQEHDGSGGRDGNSAQCRKPTPEARFTSSSVGSGRAVDCGMANHRSDWSTSEAGSRRPGFCGGGARSNSKVGSAVDCGIANHRSDWSARDAGCRRLGLLEVQWTVEWQTTGLTAVVARQEAIGRDMAAAELAEIARKLEVQWIVGWQTTGLTGVLATTTAGKAGRMTYGHKMFETCKPHLNTVLL